MVVSTLVAERALCGIWILDAAVLLTVGSFLLTMELFYSQLTIIAVALTVGAFSLTALAFFTYNWSFFGYSGKVRLIRALRDCKQRSLTVSKKTPTVSKKRFPLWICAEWHGSGLLPVGTAYQHLSLPLLIHYA